LKAFLLRMPIDLKGLLMSENAIADHQYFAHGSRQRDHSDLAAATSRS
jgi:hypothetical protein